MCQKKIFTLLVKGSKNKNRKMCQKKKYTSGGKFKKMIFIKEKHIFQENIFPGKYFPGKYFPGKYFSWNIFFQEIISRKIFSRKIFSLEKCFSRKIFFPEKYFPGKYCPGKCFPGKYFPNFLGGKYFIFSKKNVIFATMHRYLVIIFFENRLFYHYIGPF